MVEITGQLWATDRKASGKAWDLRSHGKEGSAGLCVHGWYSPKRRHPLCVPSIAGPHWMTSAAVFGPSVSISSLGTSEWQRTDVHRLT